MLVIDDFTQPGTAQRVNSPKGMNTVTDFTQDSTGALGGQRDLTLSVFGQSRVNSMVGMVGHDNQYDMDAMQVATFGLAPTVVNLLYGAQGTLAVQPAGVPSASAFVNSHALGGGLGIDLTNGGTDPKFVIQYLGLDAKPYAGLDIAITITSPGGKSSTITGVAPSSIPSYQFTMPFTNLVGNADVHHVDSVSVTFNDGGIRAPNIDFSVQLLGVQSTPVPEPASATLGAIALGSLSWTAWRRRRRKRCAPV
jgi:hypothetical protein